MNTLTPTILGYGPRKPSCIRYRCFKHDSTCIFVWNALFKHLLIINSKKLCYCLKILWNNPHLCTAWNNLKITHNSQEALNTTKTNFYCVYFKRIEIINAMFTAKLCSLTFKSLNKQLSKSFSSVWQKSLYTEAFPLLNLLKKERWIY